MAALRRTVQLSKVVSTFMNNPRFASSGWNKDWMPEIYPKNEEERRAASRRYGLLPEDYKPIVDDTDEGDYPDLPLIGEEQKSPWGDWDDPYLQRNFGEPLHMQHESIMRDKGDPSKQQRYRPMVMLATTVSLLVGIFTLVLFLQPYSMISARYRMWYPYEDIQHHIRGDPIITGKKQTHYTFEPAE